MRHSGHSCGSLRARPFDDPGHTYEMYFQPGDQLPDKQVSDRRAKKTFVCYYINHLLTYPYFLSSTDDHYVKAVSEASKINFSHLYGFLLHHDVIFKFSPDGHRLQELSKILHQYAGISWVWVAQVHNSVIGFNVKRENFILNGDFI